MKIRNTWKTVALGGVATALMAGNVAAQDESGIDQGQISVQSAAEGVLRDWEEEPAGVARELIERYGEPEEITANRLIWHNNGQWKRTEIVNEQVSHNFPKPHNDFLYQTVEFPVPEEKAGEIIQMSGSLLIDRVKGEVTARCDSEKANMLSLNLMNQIIDGRKNAKSARDTYAATMLEDKHQDLTERLHFSWQQFDEAADPGITYGGRDEGDANAESGEEIEEQDQVDPEARRHDRFHRRQEARQRWRERDEQN